MVFISHGAPNILLRDNSFTRALQSIPATLPERPRGVLIIGSGGTVHNLGIIEPEETPTRPWAVEFDDWLLENLARGDRDALFDYSRLAPHADRAVPRAEHFVNFFSALGAAHPGENAANAAAPADAATAQTGAGGTLAKVTVVDRSYLFGALSMLTLTFS